MPVLAPPDRADWSDVDLAVGVFTVRRAFAKGRLKPYPKTVRSRRRVPLRARVLDALVALDRILFPASAGGRINIDNFRTREWVPALKAAGVEHRRIYDMRHTFATWSLAAGMSNLHAVAADGHEHADDRQDVRAPGARR